MEPNMNITKKTVAQIGLLALLVISTTILHYHTDSRQLSIHIVFRELYFLPIILAGFWFGLYGGLGTALVTTVLYLPFVLSLPQGISGHNLGNIVQILLFNIFGVIVGLLRDRDIRRQKRLRDAESLIATGTAVSSIAHDMKTPLVAIGGFVQQVRKKITDRRLADKLDMVLEQVQRMETMVNDMLTFGRPLHLQCEPCDIGRLLTETARLAEPEASLNQVQIVTDLQDPLPEVSCDKKRLQQALLNLLNNGVEASPTGARVRLRAFGRRDRVLIEVANQGEGIPGKDLPHIFTPFYTTKKEGTGLGLPIVAKIVEAHGGSIRVAENTAVGVSFRIILPVRQK